MDDVTIRIMTPADAPAIASLHATSWRSAYRGILSDEYLDNAADADRALHWTRRLASPEPISFGLVAELNRTPCGFAYVVGNEHERYGSLLDNLHVLPELKGHGVGRRLMARIAAELLEREWDSRMHLWVYEDNTNARAFYDRLHGKPVERITKITLDDLVTYQWRYFWEDVRRLR